MSTAQVNTLCGGFHRLVAEIIVGGMTYQVNKSDADWRAELTPEEFRVLRQAGTEYPHSSPLDREKRPGKFACAGCQLSLFSSQTKFDSGTGWPSFTRPLKGAVATAIDESIMMRRIEALCRRCGGHLGHVFNDGPRPTGQRWCINGVALHFVPASSRRSS